MPESCGDECEIESGIAEFKKLAKVFGELDYVIGNHEDRHYRIGSRSKKRIKDFNDLYELPEKWNVCDDINILVGDDKNIQRDLYVKHNICCSTEVALKETHCCLVQSHWHAQLNIVYKKVKHGEIWGVTAGCLADANHPLARYGCKYLRKPVLGVVVVVNGLPYIVKMEVDENNRWIGRL